MNKNYIIILLLLPFFKVSANSLKPKDGYVPNKQTALKISEAVLVSIYGDKVLEQKPFKVSLKNNIWNITGTVHCPKNKKTCKGGHAHIKINKTTAEVVELSHGR